MPRLLTRSLGLGWLLTFCVWFLWDGVFGIPVASWMLLIHGTFLAALLLALGLRRRHAGAAAALVLIDLLWFVFSNVVPAHPRREFYQRASEIQPGWNRERVRDLLGKYERYSHYRGIPFMCGVPADSQEYYYHSADADLILVHYDRDDVERVTVYHD